MRARLSRWLFGHELTWEGAGTEEPVPLTQPVPVYITYLTAMPEDGTSIAYFDDVYGRDKAQAGDDWQQHAERSQARGARSAFANSGRR